MQRKIYETPGEKRKDFWIGFLGWFVLNIVMGLLGFAVSLVLTPLASNVDFETSTTIMNSLSLLVSCLPFVINIGLMVYFAFTRSQIAMGMLAAFGVVLFISICLGIIATAACFVVLGSINQ
ncbi:MAG: hypothetical protein HUU38_00720 [Anaerolineales bacterium]|nr:hypothetical protein [Anaerolineales bacterium]